jgi:AraC-like DNA-binding protein
MNLDKQLLTGLLSALLLLIFIFFLIHKGWKNRSNFFLALFFFSQLAGILAEIPFNYMDHYAKHYPNLIFIGVPWALLWAPGLYLYVASVTGNLFRKPGRNLVHFIPFLFYAMYFLLAYHVYPQSQKPVRLSLVLRGEVIQKLNLLINIQVFVYNVLSVCILHNYRKQIMDQLSAIDRSSLRWLIFMVYGYLLACFSDDIALQMISRKFAFDYLPFSKLVFFIFYIVLFYKGFTSQEVFVTEMRGPKYKNSTLTKQKALEILRKLDEYIGINKPYLNPELTIRDLAQQVCAQDRHLSQVINEYKKQNFYDFINSLRIEEVRKLFTDPSNSFNILQVMYVAGFNSKTAFNKAFKKHTGTTPSQFKNSLKTDPLLITKFQYN